MSEARELFERFRTALNRAADQASKDDRYNEASFMHAASICVFEALATQTKPGAVPELPEWSWQDDQGDLRIRLASKHMVQILDAELSPDDLDRIAEACTKLAARERARRAQS